nr:hypothetical protein [uncultured Anaerocolumna sp.]
MKKVICACIDQLLQFDSKQEVELFIELLKSKNQQFKIEFIQNMPNGTVQVRIKKQYNNNSFEEFL